MGECPFPPEDIVTKREGRRVVAVVGHEQLPLKCTVPAGVGVKGQ